MKNNKNSTRAFYVEKFIEYMDNHPVHASIMVISFCAGMLLFFGALAAVLVLLAKSGNLGNLVQIVASIFIGT